MVHLYMSRMQEDGLLRGLVFTCEPSASRAATQSKPRAPGRVISWERISTDYGLGSRHIPHSEGPSGKSMLL
jgi:hypothetical protein